MKKGIAPIWVEKIPEVRNDLRTLKEMMEMMLNLSFIDVNIPALVKAKVPEVLATLKDIPECKNQVDQILFKLNLLDPEIKHPPPSTSQSSSSPPNHPSGSYLCIIRGMMTFFFLNAYSPSNRQLPDSLLSRYTHQNDERRLNCICHCLQCTSTHFFQIYPYTVFCFLQSLCDPHYCLLMIPIV